MIKLLNDINGWVQSGPSGNDLQAFNWNPFGSWGEKGGPGIHLGKYAGSDLARGWQEHGDWMRKRGEGSLGEWATGYGWKGKSDPYGLASKLEQAGISEFGFDPTNIESIGEALARRDFKKDVEHQLSTAPTHKEKEGDDIWRYAEDIDTSYDYQRRANVQEEDVHEYWQAWKEDADMDMYTNLAKTSGITQSELGQLQSTDPRWRRMENPLMQEATDVYRGGLQQIMANLGGLRTGSAARRRKDLLAQHGKNITDIRLKTAGARGKHADTLVGRIAKLMQT